MKTNDIAQTRTSPMKLLTTTWSSSSLRLPPLSSTPTRSTRWTTLTHLLCTRISDVTSSTSLSRAATTAPCRMASLCSRSTSSSLLVSSYSFTLLLETLLTRTAQVSSWVLPSAFSLSSSSGSVYPLSLVSKSPTWPSARRWAPPHRTKASSSK